MSAFKWDKPTAEQLAARKRWVELLRSGKYEQLKGYLATEDGTKRCCLGVACDPVVTGIEVEWTPYVPTPTSEPVRQYADRSRNYPTLAFLPLSIQEQLGLPTNSPQINGKSPGDFLIDLNDYGSTFPEIADLIEATYITPHEQVSA